MWFRVLSFVIAAALIGKASVALAAPRRFYARRREQYASEKMPSRLLIPPAVTLALTLVSWFATIFHYRPWGWLVTGFLSVLSAMALHHAFHWEKHRRRMLVVVMNSSVSQIDFLLLALGSMFVALALFVY